MAEYFVLINLFLWTKTGEYWKTRGELFAIIQERFEKEGISFAIPKQDIRLISGSEKGLPLLSEKFERELSSREGVATETV